MRTPNAMARKTNATKPKQVFKSAMAKRKSFKCQKPKKSVRFDLLVQVAPSDAALYQKCTALCRKEWNRKSHSCEDLMREPFLLGTTDSKWRSLTCLAPLRSQTKMNDCLCGLSSSGNGEDMFTPGCSSDRQGLNPTQGKVCRPLKLSRRRFISCRNRIPTPRWIRRESWTELADTASSVPISGFVENAQATRSGCFKNPSQSTEVSQPCRKSFEWSMPTRLIGEPSLKTRKKGNDCERPFVEEDLSMSIQGLQIASMMTATQPQCFSEMAEQDLRATTHGLGINESNRQTRERTCNLTTSESGNRVENNDCDEYDEMDIGAASSLGEHDSFCDLTTLNKDANSNSTSFKQYAKSKGNRTYCCDANNNSVDKQLQQRVTNKTHNSPKNSAIPPVSVYSKRPTTKTFSHDEIASSSRSKDNENFSNGVEENLSILNTVSTTSTSTSVAQVQPRTNKLAIKEPLDRSCSEDFITAESLSTCSRLHESIGIPENLSEEIEEEFLEEKCQRCQADMLKQQTARCDSATEETETEKATQATISVVKTTEALLDELTALTNNDSCTNENYDNPYDSNQSHNTDQTDLNIMNQQCPQTNYTDVHLNQMQSGGQELSSRVSPKQSPSSVSMQTPSTTTATFASLEVQANEDEQMIETGVSVDCLPTSLTSWTSFYHVDSRDVASCSSVRGTMGNDSRTENVQSIPQKDMIEQEVTEEQLILELKEKDNCIYTTFRANDINVKEQHVVKSLYLCPVLNCGLHFSNQSLLDDHLDQMRHSPCNPLSTVLDGVEPNTGQRFLCPICGSMFEHESSCLEHMLELNHARLMSPVRSSVYSCPECLNFFNDLSLARQHMEDLAHHGLAFYFTDDTTTANRAQPIPVPELLTKELIWRCGRVQHSIVCQDCRLGLEDAADLRSHLHRRHLVVAKCCTSVRDIFADLLTDQACAECGQFIYQGLPPTGLCVHTDCPMQGPVLSWHARTMREFLLRCGIAGVHLGTEDTLDCSQFVGSGNRPSSPLPETWNKARDRDACTSREALRHSLSDTELQIAGADSSSSSSRLTAYLVARSSSRGRTRSEEDSQTASQEATSLSEVVSAPRNSAAREDRKDIPSSSLFEATTDPTIFQNSDQLAGEYASGSHLPSSSKYQQSSTTSEPQHSGHVRGPIYDHTDQRTAFISCLSNMSLSLCLKEAKEMQSTDDEGDEYESDGENGGDDNDGSDICGDFDCDDNVSDNDSDENEDDGVDDSSNAERDILFLREAEEIGERTDNNYVDACELSKAEPMTPKTIPEINTSAFFLMYHEKSPSNLREDSMATGKDQRLLDNKLCHTSYTEPSVSTPDVERNADVPRAASKNIFDAQALTNQHYHSLMTDLNCRTVRDQSIQVGSTDNLDTSKVLYVTKTEPISMISRLTTKIIHPSDTIVISSFPGRSDDNVAVGSNSSESDIRYTVCHRGERCQRRNMRTKNSKKKWRQNLKLKNRYATTKKLSTLYRKVGGNRKLVYIGKNRRVNNPPALKRYKNGLRSKELGLMANSSKGYYKLEDDDTRYTLVCQTPSTSAEAANHGFFDPEMQKPGIINRAPKRSESRYKVILGHTEISTDYTNKYLRETNIKHENLDNMGKEDKNDFCGGNGVILYHDSCSLSSSGHSRYTLANNFKTEENDLDSKQPKKDLNCTFNEALVSSNSKESGGQRRNDCSQNDTSCDPKLSPVTEEGKYFIVRNEVGTENRRRARKNENNKRNARTSKPLKKIRKTEQCMSFLHKTDEFSRGSTNCDAASPPHKSHTGESRFAMVTSQISTDDIKPQILSPKDTTSRPGDLYSHATDLDAEESRYFPLSRDSSIKAFATSKESTARRNVSESGPSGIVPHGGTPSEQAWQISTPRTDTKAQWTSSANTNGADSVINSTGGTSCTSTEDLVNELLSKDQCLFSLKRPLAFPKYSTLSSTTAQAGYKNDSHVEEGVNKSLTQCSNTVFPLESDSIVEKFNENDTFVVASSMKSKHGVYLQDGAAHEATCSDNKRMDGSQKEGAMSSEYVNNANVMTVFHKVYNFANTQDQDVKVLKNLSCKNEETTFYKVEQSDFSKDANCMQSKKIKALEQSSTLATSSKFHKECSKFPSKFHKSVDGRTVLHRPQTRSQSSHHLRMANKKGVSEKCRRLNAVKKSETMKRQKVKRGNGEKQSSKHGKTVSQSLTSNGPWKSRDRKGQNHDNKPVLKKKTSTSSECSGSAAQSQEHKAGGSAARFSPRNVKTHEIAPVGTDQQQTEVPSSDHALGHTASRTSCGKLDSTQQCSFSAASETRDEPISPALRQISIGHPVTKVEEIGSASRFKLATADQNVTDDTNTSFKSLAPCVQHDCDFVSQPDSMQSNVTSNFEDSAESTHPSRIKPNVTPSGRTTESNAEPESRVPTPGGIVEPTAIISAAVDASSSQAAPQLARSMMLSLDGPSSSRSSLLSTARTSAAMLSYTQGSILLPVHRRLRYHKLRTPKIQHLSGMASIVFADLENFMFFKHFRGQLPPLTFVWGFVSARPQQPFHREKYFRKFELYRTLKSEDCTHVSTDIGFGKDAVDFAMTLVIAKLDDRLPANIPFYIVSNDGGFREVENQMRRARRQVKVVAPRRHPLTSALFM